MEENNRISLIDSFRCIAVFFVMLYHYYARWNISGLETTGDFGPYHKYLELGAMGVQFFFIISGFIIMYAIKRTDSYIDFIKKRFIRLFPPILLCSVITYIAVRALDKNNSFLEFHTSIESFIPSLTFSNVCFWQFFFRHNVWDYIDASYWTLHIEVTFYIIAGLLYFINKEKFISNWVIIAFVLTVISFFYEFLFPTQKLLSTFCNMFRISGQMVYFTIGILGCAFFLKEKIPTWTIVMGSIVILYRYAAYYVQFSIINFYIFCFITTLFAAFVFTPKLLKFLDYKLLQHIGVISYTIYLIHQFIGVLLINKIIQIVNNPALNLYIPIPVICIIIVFAELSYRFYERPVSSYLKSVFNKKSI